MGLFDDLGKALKQVEEEVKKSDLDKHLKNVGEGLNKAGKDISAEVDKNRSPAVSRRHLHNRKHAGRPASRSPHPGYQKIAAWMKRNYKDRIAGSGDPFQRGTRARTTHRRSLPGTPGKRQKKGSWTISKNRTTNRS